MRSILPKITGDASELTITSLEVAKGTKYRHDHVIKIITRNKAALEQLGVLPTFVQKPQKGGKGGRPSYTYALNFRQALFVTSSMQNTAVVTQFRLSLVTRVEQMYLNLLDNAHNDKINRAASIVAEGAALVAKAKDIGPLSNSAATELSSTGKEYAVQSTAWGEAGSLFRKAKKLLKQAAKEQREAAQLVLDLVCRDGDSA